MTKFNIFTLFPEMIKNYFDYSILNKAKEKGIIEINLINFRNYAKDKNQKVDDEPYGGGAGMILKIEPIVFALENFKNNSYTILLSPKGKTVNYQNLKKLSKKIKSQKFININLICGRYEGFDFRINHFVDEVISIGDFVLTGGELPAALLVDSLSRLIPGVIKEKSLHDESFINNTLEYAQYTRPFDFQGYKVPKVLISGDHQKIKEWKKKSSLKITRNNRTDLIKKIKK